LAGLARAVGDAVKWSNDAIWQNVRIRWLSDQSFEVTLDIDGPSFVVSVRRA